VIQPASTDAVYVPQYGPWVVYGSPSRLPRLVAVSRDFTPTVQESLLDWGLGSDYSPAMAGVATIGMVAGPSTTTKASSRIVETS
jgi:hypothetical protein